MPLTELLMALGVIVALVWLFDGCQPRPLHRLAVHLAALAVAIVFVLLFFLPHLRTG